MALPSPKPLGAFVLSLLGGVFILLGGIVFSLLSPFFGFNVFGFLGLVFGVIVFVCAFGLYSHPEQHVAWGVLILIFSVVSIVSFGGFVAGLVLGTIGGALAIAWKPGGERPPMATYAGPYGVPVMPWRMCMGCGRWIPWAYNVCPLCGTQAPLPAWTTAPAYAPPSAAAPAAVPAQAPPPAMYPTPAPAEPVKAPCPTCDQEAEWMPTVKRWFCRAEARYF